MKTKLIIFVLSLFLFGNSLAQLEFFNTAYSTINSNNLINTLAVDSYWKVSTTGLGGPYNMNAVRWDNPITAPYGWSPPISQGLASNAWIVPEWNPYPCDLTNPSNILCLGNKDLWFQHGFNLTSTTFALNLNIFADDQIVDLWIDGISQGFTSALGPMWGKTFKKCSGWTVGYHTITIQVNAQPTPQNEWIGLKVESNYGSFSITGPANVCPNTISTYQVTGGATNFVWSLPSGWSGGGNSASVNLTSPSASGSGIIGVTLSNSSGCLGTATMAVNVFPQPTINVGPPPTICQGGCTNINASGGVTYTWTQLPNTTPFYTGPNSIVNVCPNSTTTYKVKGTDANGCVNTNQITVNVNPKPTLTFNASPQVICPGVPNVLTAGGTGAVLYQWSSSSFPTSTNNPYTINPTSGPITVTLAGVSSANCYAFQTYTLNSGQAVLPIVSDVTLCTNASTSVPITATSNFAGPIVYTWQGPVGGPYLNGAPNGVTGQNQIATPPLSPVPASYAYVVTASSAMGCATPTTINVAVIDKCCSQPTTGLTVLDPNNLGLIGTYANTSYLVTNNITLQPGVTNFNDAEFQIMKDVTITVPVNSTLNISHGHLYACGTNMWQGIVVDDGGYLSTGMNPSIFGSNLIEDAKVAIDLSNISVNYHGPQPLSIWDVIFNKNYIGINISNADPTISTLPIQVWRCVFTSRTIPYTTPAPFTNASWPNTVGAVNYRIPFSPSAPQGLIPPYLALPSSNYAFSNLKKPYASQPGHVGIKIENVCNQAGAGTSKGVEINPPVSVITNGEGYNVFDGIGIGIDIVDGSLTTYNNVFQNMKQYSSNGSLFGGIGINHNVTSMMNARLDLRPDPYYASGNRFWDCYAAVVTNNVYEVNIETGIFRSTHTCPAAPGAIGGQGISLNSNRMNYNISQCEFNNVDRNIDIVMTGGPYDINGSSTVGTYAGNLTIDQNYFGAEVNSSTPLSPSNLRYSNMAITIDGSAGFSWQMAGAGKIRSNKIDRAFKGIRQSMMQDYPTEIGGNDIQLINDNCLYIWQEQYGIYIDNSQDNMVVNRNAIKGEAPLPPNTLFNKNVRLAKFEANNSISSNKSPVISCNKLKDSYIGFEFVGQNVNTEWTLNEMKNHERGMMLLNNGEIGPQGNASTASSNYWLGNIGTWNAPNVFQTWSENSNALLSPIWVSNNMWRLPGYWDAGCSCNIGINGGILGINYMTSSGPSQWPWISKFDLTDCVGTIYQPTPAQRLMDQSLEDKSEKLNIVSDWTVDIFPNPSNGNINLISSMEKDLLSVRIIDVTGKLVFLKTVNSGAEGTLDITHLKSAMYFIEIQNSKHEIIRKKLIKE